MNYSSINIEELSLRDADRKIEFHANKKQAENKSMLSTLAMLMGKAMAAGTNTGYSGKPRALNAYLKDVESMFAEKKEEVINDDDFEEIGNLLSGRK